MKRLAFPMAIAALTFTAGVALTVVLVAFGLRINETLAHAGTPAGLNVNVTVPDASFRVGTEEEEETAAEPQKSAYLKAVEFTSHNPEYALKDGRIDDLGEEEIEIGLQIGESVESQLIRLRPQPGTPRVFKVEHLYETVINVYGEEPKARFLGQKYFNSRWMQTKLVEKNTFLTPTLSKPGQRDFPRAARKEVFDAVFKSEGKEWAEYARGCRTPAGRPCDLFISGISFRIKVKEGGRWKEINQINFIIPLSY